VASGPSVPLGVNEWREKATVHPHPGCFRKRGWICLIAKELTFLGQPKSPQVTENKGATKAGSVYKKGNSLGGRSLKWLEDQSSGRPMWVPGRGTAPT